MMGPGTATVQDDLRRIERTAALAINQQGQEIGRLREDVKGLALDIALLRKRLQQFEAGART